MDLLNAYRRMLRLRIAEQELVQVYLAERLFSMVHFYVGEEASAVGICDALEPRDKVLGNHRSHGHYLAKGGNFQTMAAEMFGRKTGFAGGKGGSMHMIDKSVNFIGSTPILGSVAPIAAGVAFEQKFSKTGGITVAFYGDGASEEGIVYEAYHLASLFRVPLLFIIENNRFSINSKVADRRGDHYDIESIATGFGVKYMRADGNDYRDVYTKASELVKYVRTESRPALLETMVYRHMAHSTPLTDETYRDIDTLEERTKSDPITRVRNELQSQGMSEKELQTIEDEIRAAIHADIEAALAAPYPDKEEMYQDMYA